MQLAFESACVMANDSGLRLYGTPALADCTENVLKILQSKKKQLVTVVDSNKKEITEQQMCKIL